MNNVDVITEVAFVNVDPNRQLQKECEYDGVRFFEMTEENNRICLAYRVRDALRKALIDLHQQTDLGPEHYYRLQLALEEYRQNLKNNMYAPLFNNVIGDLDIMEKKLLELRSKAS